MSTSAASSPLRFTAFTDQAGARMRLSDDGQRRQWARTSDNGSGKLLRFLCWRWMVGLNAPHCPINACMHACMQQPLGIARGQRMS